MELGISMALFQHQALKQTLMIKQVLITDWGL
jgi:hypothetical protein